MCTKEEKSADVAAAACGATPVAVELNEMDLAFYLDEPIRKRCIFRRYDPKYYYDGELLMVEVTAVATINDDVEHPRSFKESCRDDEYTVRVALKTEITQDLHNNFINSDASMSLKKMLLKELAKKVAERVAEVDLRAYVASLDGDVAINIIVDVLTVMQPKAGEARNEHYVGVDVYNRLKTLLAPYLASKPVAKPTLKDLMGKVVKLEREMYHVAGVPVRLTPTLGEGNLVTAGLAGPWGGMAAEFMNHLRCGGYDR